MKLILQTGLSNQQKAVDSKVDVFQKNSASEMEK